MAAVETNESAAQVVEEGGVRRRDFINIAAVTFAGVGGAALLYPLLNQMNASADVLALAQIDVDISAIHAGQAIKTIWRKQPIFIRNLTPAEQASANAVDVSTLRENLRAVLDHPWGEKSTGALVTDSLLYAALCFLATHELVPHLAQRLRR